jgi:hypothetical protein
MDDNLVGYLLRALDPETEREVEAQLAARPELQSRLELLRRALAPLASDADEEVPPPGLVLGTYARIAEHRCRSLPQAPPPSAHQRIVRSRRVPRHADLLVAASLLVVLGGLAAVGLARWWRASYRAACAENMRVVWTGLQNYSDQREGNFPALDKEGPRSPAGIFVPVLQEAGALSPDVSLVCPGEGNRVQPPPRLLRDMDELYHKDRTRYDRIARELAGSYAYSLGYLEGGELRQLRRESGDDRLPILADRLPCGAPGDSNSPNHGGEGQNVLFIGGNVRWCTQRNVGVEGDDIYLNRDREPRAGLARDDTVLGCSEVTPMPPAER